MPNICKVPGCANPSRAWGLCSMHFQRAYKYGSPDIKQRQGKGETDFKCTVKNCNRPHKSKGFCTLHYQRFKHLGDPMKTKIRPHGAGTIVTDGYLKITLPDGKRILEHRYVMEQHIGRALKNTEVVHHIDGNPLNNDISNLVLTTQSVHIKELSPNCLASLVKGRKLRWAKKR